MSAGELSTILVTGLVAGLVVMWAVSGQAAADESPIASAGRAALGHPPKDCTRLNGRNGYYGNPWCDEAQQRAWDLWTDPQRSKGQGPPRE
jgi:hypothetical protein